MHLIQILLPLRDREGQALGAETFNSVRGRLAEAFGGLTFYRNAPAEGIGNQEKKASTTRLYLQR